MSLKGKEKLGCSLADNLKAQAPLLAFSTIYALLAFIYTPMTLKSLLLYSGQAFVFMLISFLTLYVIYLFFKMLFITKPKSPLGYLFTEIKLYFKNNFKLAYATPLFIAYIIFMFSFPAFKSQIAIVHPFAWDLELHKLDVDLHFGRMPWEWLSSILGHPLWPVVLNYTYILWFLLTGCASFLACSSNRHYQLGIRYIIASMILWVVAGNLIALFFSSAGPCYYGFLGLGNDPYASLMNNLNQVSNEYLPLLALKAQEIGWEAYRTNDAVLIGGVSAFPSMHVANSALMAIAIFAYKPFLGWILTLFTLMILIGSIMLGWHYAVDGYAGVVLGLAAWWISAPISKWYVSRDSFKVLK